MPVGSDNSGGTASGKNLRHLSGADPAVEKFCRPEHDPDVSIGYPGSKQTAGAVFSTIVTAAAVPGILLFAEVSDKFFLAALVAGSIFDYGIKPALFVIAAQIQFAVIDGRFDLLRIGKFDGSPGETVFLGENVAVESVDDPAGLLRRKPGDLRHGININCQWRV